MSVELTIEDVAGRAGVDVVYVRRLIDLGVVGPEKGGYRERDAHVTALLHIWEEAGLTAESILAAAESGQLTLDFLESPGWELPPQLDRTYRQLAEERNMPVDLLQAIHRSMGFIPPDADERANPDDVVVADLARMLLDIGGSQDAIGRLFRVYADNLRRLALAEADLYVEQIERPSRSAGTSEPELMRRGAGVGRDIAPLVKAALAAIYERHRQHVWAQHSVETAEAVLEGAGLYQRVERTPAICFVDLTGYTRLTEEQGDETAARLASHLGALVDGVALRHAGRPVRWLGDGGMFLFREATAAVRAALEMSEGAPAAGLPTTHIGIQSGPVVFQDGDVYGRTVNVASRIADLAEAGDVLTTEETMRRVGAPEIDWTRVGPVELQGVARPVTLFRATRRRDPHHQVTAWRTA
jgi:class 3 adenylate cyclase